jgi:hypothetical protein
MLHPVAREFLTYLQKNLPVRQQIRAMPDRTLLYAGSFFKPVWKEIADLKRQRPELAGKSTLPEVLARIATPGTPHPNLLAYVQHAERLLEEQGVPWSRGGFVLWRALSGIFASNAVGAVSFQVGSGIKPGEKVFAVTELPVLLRNAKLDPVTRDLLAYYDRCIRNGQADISMGVMQG